MAEETTRRRDRSETLWMVLAPALGRLSLAVLLAALGLLVFVLIAHEVTEAGTRRLDAAVVAFFQARQAPLLHTFLTGVSWLAGPVGQTVVVAAAVLGFALARRFWPDGAALLLAGVGGTGLVVGLKHLFARPRPNEVFSDRGYSFPSGHAFFAVVVYGMLAYWLTRDMPPRDRRIAWALSVAAIGLVGFSRVFLGEHYPSDVLAGFAAGVPWAWGCLALPAAFHRRGRDLTPEEARARYEQGRARLKEAALFLPNLVKLAGRLTRDPRVPLSRKIGLGLLLGYLAMPFDLVPDFIPVLGVADDVILASAVLGWVVRAVPREVVREHWDGATDLFALLDRAREGVRNLMNRA